MAGKRIEINMELLKRLYVDEKKSLVTCGKLLGYSSSMMKSRLIEMGYEIRKRWEWAIGRSRTEEERKNISLGHIGVGLGKKRVSINMEKLKTLYIDEGKSFKVCAKELGCSIKVIRSRLVEMNCQIRSHWPLGLTFSEERKKKMGDARRGRKHSEEAKRNMSKAQKGKKHPWMSNQYGKNNPNWNGGLFLGIEDPIISRCYDIVRNAKRTGEIVKQPCEICGLPGHAHHDDYEKPFDIRWLCPSHHTLFHRKHILTDYKYVSIKEAN